MMGNNRTLNYLITDHLGSVVAVTDTSGLLLEETRYMPFGSPRSDVGMITGTDKSFTGQKSLANTGLLDYNARMYSSELGRFTQPDTLIPGAGNPQAWNRYAYTLNNPVKYTDPSGNRPCWEGKTYRCNLTLDQIQKLHHSNNNSERKFILNYLKTRNLGALFSEIVNPEDNIRIQPGERHLLNLLEVDPFSRFVSDSFVKNSRNSNQYSESETLPNLREDMNINNACENSPKGCILGGAILIIATDVFIGIPLFAVAVLSGFATPPAIAAEIGEVLIVLPVNLFGMYLIKKGSETEKGED